MQHTAKPDMNRLAAAPADLAELERSAIRKAGWRLIPIVALGYFLADLERTSVGFGALTMLKQLQMSATEFGLGASSRGNQRLARRHGIRTNGERDDSPRDYGGGGRPCAFCAGRAQSGARLKNAARGATQARLRTPHFGVSRNPGCVAQ
jgi:hypothetical protein